MSVVTDFINARNALYEHVGFVEDWVIYAIEDNTEMYWRIDGGRVLFSEKREDALNETGDHYENEIYTQRFYKKHVYGGEQFTMIFVDTRTDGNRFFAIFDNDKEIKEN